MNMNNRKLNIDIQKLFYRVTPLLCCLVLLVAMFPVRAFATEYFDYNDYITDVQVDGEKDLVTVSIPQRYSYIWVNEHGNLLSYGSGGELYVELAGGSTARYDIGFRPLGADGYLLLDNIPNGTQITQAFTVSISNTSSGIVTPLYSVYTDYRGADGPLGDQLLMSDYVSWFEKQTVTWTVDKPSGADGMRPFVWLQNVYFMDANQQVTITLEPMVMTMSISSLYRLQEETGKTNDLLQLVLEKLDQIEQENLTWYEKIWKAITDGFNAVLDAIGNIIGISEEDKQAAEDFKNDAIDKSEKLEGAVDAMGSVNKPPADQVQADMDSMLPSDGGIYVSQTMNVIVGIPLVTEQLSIVVIIMFASFVLFGKKEA